MSQYAVQKEVSLMVKPSSNPYYGQGFIIHDWMIRCFGLQGDYLIIYAYIHSFSKDTRSKYYGSLRQLSFWCGKTKPVILKKLQYLVDNGLIEKEEIPYTGANKERHYCRYWTTFSRLPDKEKQRILSTTGIEN